MEDVQTRAGHVLDGRYRIIRLLARSMMSEVYEAVDTGLNRSVAYKTLPGTSANVRRDRSRFLKATNAHLSIRHPNVVCALDTGTSRSGHPYIVTPYVQGGSLRQRLRASGPMELSAACTVILQVLAGLSAAHSHEIPFLHCDVKPENILFNDGGEAVLIDFGIARALSDPASTMREEMFGTPGYMPPEAMGEHPALSKQSDIFSAGVVFYEMLTGRLPFPGKSHQLVHSQIMELSYEPPSAFCHGVSHELDKIVARALLPDPGKRFRSVRKFAAAVAQAEKQRPRWKDFVPDPDDTLSAMLARLLGSHVTIGVAVGATVLLSLVLWQAPDLVLRIMAASGLLVAICVLTMSILGARRCLRGR